MTARNGTIVDQTVVAGGDDRDDFPVALNSELKGAVQIFQDADQRDQWTQKYPSRVPGSVALVINGGNEQGVAELYEWQTGGFGGPRWSLVMWVPPAALRFIDIDGNEQELSSVNLRNIKIIQVNPQASSMGLGETRKEPALQAFIEMISKGQNYEAIGIELDNSLKVVNNNAGWVTIAVNGALGEPESIVPGFAARMSEEKTVTNPYGYDSERIPEDKQDLSESHSLDIVFDRVMADVGGIYTPDDQNLRNCFFLPGPAEGEEFADYLIAIALDFDGVADADNQFIDMYLLTVDPDAVIYNGFLSDADGEVISAGRNYNNGQPLGRHFVMRHVQVQSDTHFVVHYSTNIPSYYKVLKGGVTGVTGILIQPVTEKFTTSLARLEFENLIGFPLNFSAYKFDTEISSIKQITAGYIDPIDRNGGYTGWTWNNNWAIYPVNDLELKVTDGIITLKKTNDSVLVDFHVTRFFSAIETYCLKGKQISAVVETGYSGNYRVVFWGWNGDPNDETKSIYSDRNPGTNLPNPESNWTILKSEMVSGHNDGQTHNMTIIYQVPEDMELRNIAVSVIPDLPANDFEIDLKGFSIRTPIAFEKYVTKSDRGYPEQHYKFDSNHATFKFDAASYGKLEYPLKTQASAVPIGIKDSGQAQVFNYSTINAVGSFGNIKGEGALAFAKKGVVTFKPQVKIYSDASMGQASQVFAEFQKFTENVGGGGAKATPIPTSKTQMTVLGANFVGRMHQLKTFSIAVEPGDIIGLTMWYEGDAGPKIVSNGTGDTAVIIDIDYHELESDIIDPTVVDESSISKFYSGVKFAEVTIENSDTKVINMDKEKAASVFVVGAYTESSEGGYDSVGFIYGYSAKDKTLTVTLDQSAAKARVILGIMT